MRVMSAAEIAGATGGIWRHPDGAERLPDGREFAAASVSTDSRNIPSAGDGGYGCLFVALTGEKFDGHDYLESALDSGAAGCLCARLPETLRPDRFYIQVPDTRLALGRLAAAYRREFSIPFVQITGSVGKTTTKEMLSAVLGEKLRVLKTEGNFNNDIGVPLTLLRVEKDHEAAVIETGMNHAGEISYLGGLVRPDIAVITNIGDAHRENLGSREGILKAKCEIFDHLKADGLAVLNGDDKLLRGVEIPFRTVRCGYLEDCAVRIVDFFDRSVAGIACTIRTERDTYTIEIPSPGAYMVYPAAMAVAVGEALGLNREEIIRGAASYAPTGSRMRVLHLRDGRILLDDCYNANPQSVTAALEVLSRTECGKRVAVLGDMGELGGYAEKAHYNIGALTAMLGIDLVIAIGECAAGIAEGAEQNGGEAYHFPTKEAAMEELKHQFDPDSAMLVKASHAMRFEEIVRALRTEYGVRAT